MISSSKVSTGLMGLSSPRGVIAPPPTKTSISYPRTSPPSHLTSSPQVSFFASTGLKLFFIVRIIVHRPLVPLSPFPSPCTRNPAREKNQHFSLLPLSSP